MTHAEIMALEAGPETDTLVAEAVNGDIQCEYDVVDTKGEVVKHVKQFKFYSTKIAAAYEAEDALPEDKREAFAEALEDVLGIPPVWDTDRSLHHTWVIAHAAPIDRCKGVLVALFGEQDEERED